MKTGYISVLISLLPPNIFQINAETCEIIQNFNSVNHNGVETMPANPYRNRYANSGTVCLKATACGWFLMYVSDVIVCNLANVCVKATACGGFLTYVSAALVSLESY